MAGFFAGFIGSYIASAIAGSAVSFVACAKMSSLVSIPIVMGSSLLSATLSYVIFRAGDGKGAEGLINLFIGLIPMSFSIGMISGMVLSGVHSLVNA